MSSGNNAKKRKLKVYYGHHNHSYRLHPVIHLAGKYLEEINFKIGDAIEVVMENDRIVITKRAGNEV